MSITIAGLCFTNADGVVFSHDWKLVGLSYLIAAGGSYSALAVTERLHKKDGGRRLWWQAGSAATLGGSIWSMHFLAMLALRIDLPMSYAVGGTALSLLIAVASVAGGLAIAGSGRLSWGRLVGAGAVIGLGIAAMHYVGMAALQFPGSIAYTPVLWTLSVLIAVGAAVAALWLALNLHADWRWRALAALVMGVAICGMHYTGMAAAVFDADGQAVLLDGLARAPVAMAVAGVSLALLLVALIAVATDNRLTMASERAATAIAASTEDRALLELARIETRSTVEQEKAVQGLLAMVFLLVNTPVAILTAEGRYLMTNPSFTRVLGYRPDALVGRMALDTMHATDRPRFQAACAKQHDDVNSFSLTLKLLGMGGRELAVSLTSALPTRPDLRRFRIITLMGPEPARAPSGADVISASKIRLINLDDVKALIGNDWVAMAQRILGVAETIIRSHIGPHDSVRATADNGFVIAFTGISEAEASARAVAIGQEIRRQLIESGEDSATAEVESTTVSAAPESVPAVLDKQFSDAEADKPHHPAAVKVPGCHFEPVQGCQRGQFVGYFVDADNKSNGRQILISARSDNLPRLFEGVVKQTEQAECTQSSEIMFVNLSFAAFDNRTEADKTIECFKVLPPEARARLVILLAAIPAKIHQSRLQEVVVRLQPFCRGVGCSLADLKMPDFDLGVFKAPVVVIDGGGWDQTVPEARLAKLVLALHSKRAKLLVRSVVSMQSAQQLREDGADYVSFTAEQQRSVAAQQLTTVRA